MSSQTPTASSALGRTSVPSRGTSAHARRTALATAPCVFEPRRSVLVAVVVRMARTAARFMTGTLASAELRTSRADGFVEKALRGLERCYWWPRRHHAVLATERARLRIQQVLRVRHARHRRFLRLRESIRLNHKPLSESTSYLHLNPACHWIRYQDGTRLAGSGNLSTSALFFLFEDHIRGIRMCLEEQVLINELADYQPCTIREWARCSSLANMHELRVVVQHLHDIGLVAWENR